VFGMILRQGMAPVWVGLAMGTALSAATLRMLPTLVPLGQRYDLRSYFLILPMLILITGLAALIPSNRASQVDPALALRAD
jgi:putative ABC transport system permease protein